MQTNPENNVSPLLYTLPLIALQLADQRKQESAVETYALASRFPFIANSRWFEAVAGRHIAAIARALPPEVVASAQAQGQARGLWATAGDVGQ
jgi:hypothetical protein